MFLITTGPEDNPPSMPIIRRNILIYHQNKKINLERRTVYKTDLKLFALPRQGFIMPSLQ